MKTGLFVYMSPDMAGGQAVWKNKYCCMAKQPELGVKEAIALLFDQKGFNELDPLFCLFVRLVDGFYWLSVLLGHLPSGL